MLIVLKNVKIQISWKIKVPIILLFRNNYIFTFWCSFSSVTFFFSLRRTLWTPSMSIKTFLHHYWLIFHGQTTELCFFPTSFFVDLDKTQSWMPLEFRFVLKILFPLTSQTTISHRRYLVENIFYCLGIYFTVLAFWTQQEI